VQIGEPAVIANLTGIDVVSQFRAADMAAGGQGAPLIPYFDYALLRSSQENRVILNIGGIANITVLPRGTTLEDVVGFDTGPGNMALDGLVELITEGEQHYDRDGQIAGSGRIHEELLSHWLDNRYFTVEPPKSTGRELFGLSYCRSLLSEARAYGMSTQDLMRTATALVAESIARGMKSQVASPVALIASGGGIYNRVLMEELQNRANLVRPWESATQHGIPSDFKEAMAFALFAWAFCVGQPTNVRRTTGANRSVVLGSWTPARIGTKVYEESGDKHVDR
jgi:anhydro-N-acetylmuramic acid kinase